MVDSYEETSSTFKEGVSKTVNATGNSVSLFETTMAQSAYFKLYIEELPYMSSTSNLSSSGSLTGTAAVITESAIASGDNFLPVKSINLVPVSIETTTLPLGIFGDMAIVTRRKLGKLNIVLLDDNDERYEKALRLWYKKTVPTSGYVGYMNEIVRNLTYKSYSTTGENRIDLQYQVMLADEMSIARDYDANELKTISFSLLIVGEIAD